MAVEGGVKRQMRGAVMVLSLARPPVNALDRGLLLALDAALAEAEAAVEVRAVVLAAEGPHFSAGLDVSELGRVAGAPLARVAARIEGLAKPVVAALQGNVLGGGLELALACHGRVAQEAARLGLPEVALGLLPVAGSTQRLPRLVGAPVALKILTDGLPVTAVEALAMGLLDAAGSEPPLARAVALAESMAETLAETPSGSPRKTSDRRDGMRDAIAYQSAVTEARKRVEGARLATPAALIDCVEAALLLPFDMGLGFEAARAEELAAQPEAAGLRHAFLAERRALLPPADLAAVAPPPLADIALLGTGGAAAEVARMALQAGMKLRLVASDRPGLVACLNAIAARQEALVAEGQLAPATREADWARLTGVLAGDGVKTADLVLVAPDAPNLADLPGPVVSLGGRGGVVLHPAPVAGALAYLAAKPGAALPTQAAALAFGRKLGWKVAVQGPGLPIDHRLRLVLSRAIAALEAEGRDRPTIAAALGAFGLGAGARIKLPPAPAGGEGLLDFCLCAVMNEAGHILSEGVARRPSDVDAASLLSGLFPRWEGGPTFQADRVGLMALRANLRARAEGHPQLFTPAPLFDRLISEGRNLADLNRVPG